MSHQNLPMGNRVERKKEETKRKIISVAMNLFKKQGFNATTMEQIAAEVDIAKGTLYNYFPVKEAILDAFIQQTFQQKNTERIAQIRKLPDTRSRITFILSDLINGVRSEKEIFEKYFVYRIQNMISLSRDQSTESGLGLLETELIELGQKGAELRNDLPLDMFKALFEFVFVVVAQQFYKEPGRFIADKAIEQGVDLFMNGAKIQK
ncbi:MAG: TetR/AcrR family transcriptional regulator [Bacillota bacterium]